MYDLILFCYHFVFGKRIRNKNLVYLFVYCLIEKIIPERGQGNHQDNNRNHQSNCSCFRVRLIGDDEDLRYDKSNY